MTQGKVETFNQTGTDRQPQLLQPLGPTAHAVDQLLQPPLALLDDLAIDQIGRRLLHGLFGASRLAQKGRSSAYGVDLDRADRYQKLKPSLKSTDAQDHGGRHLDQLQGTVKRPWADKGRKDKTEFWGKTDPHPPPSVLA